MARCRHGNEGGCLICRRERWAKLKGDADGALFMVGFWVFLLVVFTVAMVQQACGR